MDIGVVFQLDPPASEVVELAQQGRGGRVQPRVDVRLAPAVAGAVRHLQPDPGQRPQRVIVGPMVTNPGTRDWTVTASLFATLNEMYGNRTICGIGRGDSALRTLGSSPARSTELNASAVEVIRELANGETVDVPRSASSSSRGSTTRALEVWVAAYGPKALALTGEVGDGYILQLADPDIAEWMINAVARGRRAGRPRSGGGQVLRRRTGLRRRRPRPPARPDPLVRRDGRQPRRRHRRPLRRRPARCRRR